MTYLDNEYSFMENEKGLMIFGCLGTVFELSSRFFVTCFGGAEK